MIAAENLVVTYSRGMRRRPFRALDDFTLRIREGDFFGLLGRNGAGKSTAMYCFLGLLRPVSGTVHVLGAAPVAGASMFRDVAYLPEEPHYHSYLTVEEALRYYGVLSGVRPTASEITRVLEQLDLVEHRDMRIARCSKGMKQKVGIAQCLIHRPRLLLLDEPMRGLDPVTVHRFRDILIALNREGVTVVMNSHILAEVEQVATRVAILERGRVLVEDTVERLVRHDIETYEVEVEPGAGFAPHVVSAPSNHGTIARAQVKAEDLYTFVDHCRATNSRLVKCSLRQRTLEDSFLAALNAEAARG